MGLFRKSSQTVITPTFIPLTWVNGIFSGLGENDRKFLDLYLSVPELQAVINYRAKAFADMIIRVKDNPEVTTPQAELFNQPNPLQGFKEFAEQYHILRDIFGNAFHHPIYGVDKKQTSTIWNLPPMDAEIIPTEAMKTQILFNMTESDEIIKQYQFKYNGSTIVYQPKEVLHFNDNQVRFDNDKFLLGDSKLRPLVQACENIKGAYEARGMLIHNSALGILSNDSTDQMGSKPLQGEDKDQLHKDYKRYGLTKQKWNLIITNASLKWQSMATDVGKLKLFDEVKDDYEAICKQFAFPPEILQTGGTYENKKEAKKQLYQDSIIPEANEWLQGWANFFGVDPLEADYSHISAFQADLEKRARSLNLAASGLDKLVKGGVMTAAEAKEQIENYLL